MSLLVHYTLKSSDSQEAQSVAMSMLVEGLKSEGIAGLHYSCFSTEDPLRFVGMMEFPNNETKQAFLDSASFAVYKETVGPTFANPPQTTEITAIASTRD